MEQHFLESISISKDDVISAVNHLPENFSAWELMKQILLEKDIAQGLADIEAGNVFSHEEMKKMIASW